MPKFIDLSGLKFNNLTVIERDFESKHHNTKWICLCDCGNKVSVFGMDLKNNHTKSCGCLALEIRTKHGFKNHTLYKKYYDMLGRCYNKNLKSYENYGGRGIRVCDEWLNNSENFIKWAIDNGWQKGLVIDRIDFNGNYEPNNCQFITPSENSKIGKQRKRKDNSSGFRGVTKDKRINKWISTLIFNKKSYWLGSFENIEDAVQARINKEIELFGKQITNIK